jgi:biopolymer transport protein ExbB/TolQ
MNINDLAKLLGDACYVFLTLNFLWGLYCVIMVARRLRQLAFRTELEQAEFLTELQQRLRSPQSAAAQELCEDDPRALPQLASVALSNRKLGFDQLRQLLAELLQRDVLGDLEYRMSWVATVIKSGPLLGLFGTVLGMMAAFGRIGLGEKVQPHMIAEEISIALVCTAMGLATAIPFSYALASMNIRMRRLQDSLGSGLLRMLEFFKTGGV